MYIRGDNQRTSRLQPEETCRFAEAGRGWRPRLEAALSLIWRWRRV